MSLQSHQTTSLFKQPKALKTDYLLLPKMYIHAMKLVKINCIIITILFTLILCKNILGNNLEPCIIHHLEQHDLFHLSYYYCLLCFTDLCLGIFSIFNEMIDNELSCKKIKSNDVGEYQL